MTALIVFLLAIGFLLILVEAIVPGGLVGVVGAVFMAAGVVLSFHYYGMARGGWILAGTLGACALVLLLAVRVLPRSPIGRKMFLAEVLRSRTSEDAEEAEHGGLVGREGKALTDLRPSGKGMIDGRKWDVVTSGSYIAKDESFLVVRVEGPRIVVEPQHTSKEDRANAV